MLPGERGRALPGFGVAANPCRRANAHPPGKDDMTIPLVHLKAQYRAIKVSTSCTTLICWTPTRLPPGNTLIVDATGRAAAPRDHLVDLSADASYRHVPGHQIWRVDVTAPIPRRGLKLLRGSRRYRPLTGQANYRMLKTRLRGFFVRETGVGRGTERCE